MHALTCKYKAESKFDRYKTLEINSPCLWRYCICKNVIEWIPGDMCDFGWRVLGQPRVAQRCGRVREGNREHQQHRQARPRDDQTLQRSLAEEHRAG